MALKAAAVGDTGLGPPSCGLRRHRSCCPIAGPMGLGSLAAITTQVTLGGHGHWPPLLSSSKDGGWRNDLETWMVTASLWRSSCIGYPGGHSSISRGSLTWPKAPCELPAVPSTVEGMLPSVPFPCLATLSPRGAHGLGSPGLRMQNGAGTSMGSQGKGGTTAQGLSLQKWMMEVQRMGLAPCWPCAGSRWPPVPASHLRMQQQHPPSPGRLRVGSCR